MQDESFDRGYQSGRAAINKGVDKAVASFISGFKRFHRLQWQSPLEDSPPRRRQRRHAGLA